LISESAAYGHFKFREVGTSNAAKANTQTALTTSTGIARATGSQVEASADVYRSVATVTADTSEAWQEHVRCLDCGSHNVAAVKIAEA
jgi:hypothetical protein